jgi:outer membrane protein TolC
LGSEAAQNNVRLPQLSYRKGNVGVLQVLDAERQLQQAKLGFVRAQAQRYIDTAQLLPALGGSPLPADSVRPQSGSVTPAPELTKLAGLSRIPW